MYDIKIPAKTFSTFRILKVQLSQLNDKHGYYTFTIIILNLLLFIF